MTKSYIVYEDNCMFCYEQNSQTLTISPETKSTFVAMSIIAIIITCIGNNI